MEQLTRIHRQQDKNESDGQCSIWIENILELEIIRLKGKS